MTAHTISESRAQRDAFVQQVVAHHRAGDHYPDPWIIGQELRLTRMQTEAVLRALRAIGWIAASPYGPERLRLTPRCWGELRREVASSPSAPRHAA